MALQGNEQVRVFGVSAAGSPSGEDFMTSTAAIAALGAAGGVTVGVTNTNINTVGAGTLTAASLVGGLVSRTGAQTAAFTDTTDTAAAIVALFPEFVAGATFNFTVKNTTAWPETITAGAGVTMSTANTIGPYQASVFYGVVGGTAGSPTVTINRVYTVSVSAPPALSTPQATALATVGAGTITAASIVAGIVTRSGIQTAAFTDTTDTVANLIAASNSTFFGHVGASTVFTYVNNTIWPATIAGAANVTVSGATVIPANSWVQYLVTFATSTTFTFVAIGQGYFPTSGTFTANGATAVTVANTAVTANSNITFTLKTVGGTPAGAPFTATITPGTGFTVKAVAGDTSVYAYEIRG